MTRSTGIGSCAALLFLAAFGIVVGCGPKNRHEEFLPKPESEMVHQISIEKDTHGTADPQNIGTPVTADDLLSDYAATHAVPPLARSIANGEKLDLTRDIEVLSLVDSMLNGHNAHSRMYYYLIVSRTLKWSDGYYSEGVGNVGTKYLFTYPSEFLTHWRDLLSAEERLQWAESLTGEQSIITEGYPCDTVMLVFKSRLRSAIRDERTIHVAEHLVHQIDSLLCLCKAHQQ